MNSVFEIHRSRALRKHIGLRRTRGGVFLFLRSIFTLLLSILFAILLDIGDRIVWSQLGKIKLLRESYQGNNPLKERKNRLKQMTRVWYRATTVCKEVVCLNRKKSIVSCRFCLPRNYLRRSKKRINAAAQGTRAWKRRPRSGPWAAAAGCTWGICTRRAGKLYRARYRLCRSQILQENKRWKALAEIYTMHSFAPFWNP